jgi:hypothetical protein
LLERFPEFLDRTSISVQGQHRDDSWERWIAAILADYVGRTASMKLQDVLADSDFLGVFVFLVCTLEHHFAVCEENMIHLTINPIK